MARITTEQVNARVTALSGEVAIVKDMVAKGSDFKTALKEAGITRELLIKAGFDKNAKFTEANVQAFLFGKTLQHEDRIGFILKHLNLKANADGTISKDMTSLEFAVTAGEAGGKNAFIGVLRESNWDDQKIAEAIGIMMQDHPELAKYDFERICALWLEDYHSFKRETRQATKRLGDTQQAQAADIKRHDESIVMIGSDVKTLQSTVVEVRDGGRFPILGFILAMILGFVTWVVFVGKTYHMEGPVTTNNAKLTGTYAGGYNNPVLALCAGFLVVLVVLLIVSLMPASARSKLTVRHIKAKSTRSTSTPAPVVSTPVNTSKPAANGQQMDEFDRMMAAPTTVIPKS